MIPEPGDLYCHHGKDRIVVAIHQVADEISVEWRRPGNDGRTWFVSLDSWKRWVRKVNYHQKNFS